ncbi:hypothetical protein U0070_016993 [Myodes glareolus]|uniref:Uncharacterized protein n=1 Tax=Myodes glareolus TaxID=447135 RepID=A0AAW0IGP4_MYOGA
MGSELGREAAVEQQQSLGLGPGTLDEGEKLGRGRAPRAWQGRSASCRVAAGFRPGPQDSPRWSTVCSSPRDYAQS